MERYESRSAYVLTSMQLSNDHSVYVLTSMQLSNDPFVTLYLC